ncbi:MAG: hypothetical protein WDN44_03405 [Sphingomonas sp.]
MIRPGRARAHRRLRSAPTSVSATGAGGIGQPSLDAEGFAPPARPVGGPDFADAEQLRSVYFPEVERILAEATGAERRSPSTTTSAMPRGRDRASPASADRSTGTHNDFTVRSGR